ncbi:MAG: YraN family protein [Clostridiales bacterium]|jgi:putative endonuclease|nr:YraN family protein [Clostridiales bacterium]
MDTLQQHQYSKHLNRAKGSLSEQLAVDYLISKGYDIVETNWQCSIGEIDIIARYQEYLVVVEVKSRTTNNYGSGLEAINYTKQNKIVNTTLAYIQHKDLDVSIRFDAIQLDKYNNITHIIDAFYSS